MKRPNCPRHRTPQGRAWHILSRAAGALLLASSPPILAQSVDYGALEQLFAEPVTTSATGSPQRASKVPTNMEIITAEDIRRSGARDIPGVLRHIVDIDLLQWGIDDTDVSVRGYNQAYSQRLLVLINGRQVYADYYSFTPWSTLPIELASIRQIEVVKGPSSALFGLNAVDGVINIITYNPLYDDKDAVAVAGGTQNLTQESAVATFKLDDWAAARISAGNRSDSDFSTAVPASMGTRPQPDNTRTAVDLDGVIRATDTVQLRFEASHVNAGQFEVNPGYLVDFSTFVANSVRAQLLADSPLGLWEASAYENQIDQRSLPAILGAPLDFANRLAVFKIQDVFKLGADHALRAAVEYRSEAVDTSSIEGGTISNDVLSASGMWDWSVTHSLSVTTAARIDRLTLARTGTVPIGYPFTNSDWNRVSDEISYNLGLVWQLDDLDVIRALAGRGVLVPNLVELGALVIQSPNLNLTGVPSLNPTDVKNYELDWDRPISQLHAQFRASVFYKDTANIFDVSGAFILTSGAPYSVPTNIGESYAHGLTLGLKGVILDNWRWGLSYRLEEVSEQLASFAQDGRQFTDYDHSTPKHLVVTNLGWARGRWEIDGYARYQSATAGLLPAVGAVGTTLVPLPQYVALDARVAYQLDKAWTFAASGQDLAHAQQRQTEGPNVERQLMGSVTFNF
ncbi:MAG TPA: TonB-dependent receptor [Steroidobacteraceae bacterium]|nr:TonB-dependent receptor [Steroidobacteraceae bacterium]